MKRAALDEQDVMAMLAMAFPIPVGKTHTPQGDLVLVTLEGDHPETAFQEFGKRTDPFTMWFKQQVSETHGMDLSAPPPGPMPQQVIDSHS